MAGFYTFSVELAQSNSDKGKNEALVNIPGPGVAEQAALFQLSPFTGEYHHGPLS
jgi:hypothetical protein